MGERLYYILKIIKEEIEPISAKNIQSKLFDYGIQVDIKTVYATIDKINDFYELLTNQKYIQAIHRKGYCIKNHYFEDGELQFLLDNIGFNPNLSNKEIEKLQERLLTMSSASQKEHITINEGKQKDQQFSLLLNLSTLLKAIRQQQPIYFRYVSYKIENHKLEEIYSRNGNLIVDDQSYYRVSPYKVVLRGGNYYLLGYFDKRKEQLSMYRVDRMRFIRNHKSQFVDIRDQFDVERDLEKNVNMFISDKKIDVTFKFKDSILREVVNQFGIDMDVHKEPNQWNNATVKDITMSEGLLGWIMMLQDQIEIILPLELREAVIDKVNSLKKIYQT
ncbi:MAG: helix-turn-helix transcriptional regulator [Coprobacillaceae bacterium]